MITERDELLKALTTMFKNTLNLPQFLEMEISESTTILEGELGIDSIDLLEIVAVLEKEYGVKIDSMELGKKVFMSFGTLLEFVIENRTK